MKSVESWQKQRRGAPGLPFAWPASQLECKQCTERTRDGALRRTRAHAGPSRRMHSDSRPRGARGAPGPGGRVRATLRRRSAGRRRARNEPRRPGGRAATRPNGGGRGATAAPLAAVRSRTARSGPREDGGPVLVPGESSAQSGAADRGGDRAPPRCAPERRSRARVYPTREGADVAAWLEQAKSLSSSLAFVIILRRFETGNLEGDLTGNSLKSTEHATSEVAGLGSPNQQRSSVPGAGVGDPAVELGGGRPCRAPARIQPLEAQRRRQLSPPGSSPRPHVLRVSATAGPRPAACPCTRIRCPGRQPI